MRVLVTGHKGYIGSVLVKTLVRAGHQVVGLDSGLFDGCWFEPPSGCCAELDMDVRDIALSDLKGFDAVLHLAALCNDPLGNLNATLTMDINHRASVRLAELAREAGVRRFLLSSSCSTYGLAGDEFLDETGQCNPVTPYGRSKVLTENALRALASETFCPVFLRNATVYGYSTSLRLDLVLNEFVASAFLTGKIVILSDGTPWRPIVHVRDVAWAFVELLTAPEADVRNQCFNVGSNAQNYRVSDLAEIVRAVVPGSRIEYAPGGGPDTRCYRVDCSKLTRVLPSFEVKWTPQGGAEQLYGQFQTRGLTLTDLEGSRFRRLLHMRGLIDENAVDGELRRQVRPRVAASTH